jgi:hypothetical protein
MRYLNQIGFLILNIVNIAGMIFKETITAKRNDNISENIPPINRKLDMDVMTGRPRNKPIAFSLFFDLFFVYLRELLIAKNLNYT